MNRIFKVIKSKRTGNDIAVSELASSKGGARRLSAALILVSGLCTSSVMAEDVITKTVEISGDYSHNGSIQVNDGNALQNIEGKNLGNIVNSGIIKGSGDNVGDNSAVGNGNGVSSSANEDGDSFTSSIESIQNSGVISGSGDDSGNDSSVGNGVSSYSYSSDDFSPSGLPYSSSIEEITNSGVIKGSNNAIYLKGDQTSSEAINNYGIMAGQNIFNENGVDQKDNINKIKNQGIFVILNADGTINGIKTGTGGTADGKTVLNATVSGKDSSVTSNASYDNYVINGAGIETGALTYTAGTSSVDNSIVNGYETALTVKNGATVSANNTIFNGGGLKNDKAVIELENGTLNITGDSIINGSTTVKNSSTLSLGNDTQLNGDISGDATSTLNLGDGTTTWADDAGYGAGADKTKPLSHNNVEFGDFRILHNISGFNQINVDGRVTTYETAKLSDIKEINIAKGAQLVVRVNPLKEGEYKETTRDHALYNSGATVSASLPSNDVSKDYNYNPQLIFKTNGMQIGDTIEMGSTVISGFEDFQMDTWSILHTAKKKGDGDVILAPNDFDDIFFPDTDDNNECNLGKPWCPIYESIKNANQLNELDPTGDAEDTEEHRREGLLSLLDQIYANNPYNQSAMLAFKNVTTLRNQIFETKMPKLNEWIAAAHVNYAQSQQTKDRDLTVGNTSIADKYKTDLSNYSALITAEHGYMQDKSLGFALGMAHSKASMSHSSKLDGNSFYLGIYNKHKVDNFEFVLGTGFSFGTYDGTRTILNQYQSVTNNGKVQTATFDFYGQAKYSYALTESTFLEPKVRLSDVIVRQSSVNEDVSALALNQDTKMYHVPAFAIGLDLGKRFDLPDSVLKTKVGILGERTFGHWDNLVDARIQNSTDFVTQGAQFQRSSVNLTASAEHDLTQKLYYKATVNYGIAQREKDNLGVGLTVGYTF